MKRWLYGIIAGVAIVLGFGASYAYAFRSSPPAPGCGKALYGRCEQNGYFTNQEMFNNLLDYTDNGTGWLYEHGMGKDISNLPGGNGDNPLWKPGDPNVTNAASFIALLQTDLNRDYAACKTPVTVKNAFINALKDISTPPLCYFNKKRAVGAAFIIDTMLNRQGPSFGNIDAGVNFAKANFGLWSSMVNAYASGAFAGASVNFSKDVSFGAGLSNNSSIVGYGSDQAFFQAAEPHRISIVFTHPDGSTYIIKKMCGNVTGSAKPFPNFLVSGLIQSGAGTPGPGSVLKAGNPYQVQAGAWNAGPGVAQPNQTYKLTIPGGITVTGLNGGTQAGNVVTWNNVVLPSLGKGAAVFKNLDFTVNAGVANGTILTFTLVVGPRDMSGANAPPVSISYVVQNPRYPSVVGNGSDIHAGGGRCNVSSGPGSVNSISQNKSGGQYVVSASANPTSINNFYSNGTSGSSDLNLGAKGGYAQVCRPDLVKIASAYHAAGVGYATISGSVDVGTLNPSYDVFFATGSISLHGTVNRKLTIVSLAGTITIAGDIKLDNVARSRDTTASLGIIAAGNINIDAAATQVDAYLFSDQTIDTCSAGNCNNVLNINGFVMAQALSLNRLGPLNSVGAVAAENITLNPEIYLNPPTLFDAAADQSDLQGQGEKPPLY